MATTKNNLSKISNNDLSELAGLVNRISSLIDRDYCHVSEHLSQTLFSEIAKIDKQIEKEYERREL